MDVNLDLYRVFYAVARKGSLAKATEELYVSQPAVSQAIKQLESQLGGKLFLRTPKGMKLTKEGEVMLGYIEKVYDLLKEAENTFCNMLSQTTGTIKIGASDTLCKYYLLERTKSFHQEYKDAVIQLVNRTTPQIIDMLKHGQIDMGFCNLPVQNAGELDVIKVMDVEDIFVCSPDYINTQNVYSLQDISTYPLIMIESGTSTRQAIDNYLKGIGVVLTPEIELGSMDLLIEYAKAGMGIACVTKQFCQKELQEGSLVELQVQPRLPVRAIGLLTKGNSLSFIAKQFYQKILRSVE